MEMETSANLIRSALLSVHQTVVRSNRFAF